MGPRKKMNLELKENDPMLLWLKMFLRLMILKDIERNKKQPRRKDWLEFMREEKIVEDLVAVENIVKNFKVPQMKKKPRPLLMYLLDKVEKLEIKLKCL